MPHPQISSIPSSWIIVTAENSYSERLEVHLTHDKEGILILIEEEKLQHFFGTTENRRTADNQTIPVIPNIKMICTTSS